MKKFYLACLALLLPHLMQAQTSTCASDTLLFRECFSDSILKTDVELMREVYYEVLGGPKVTGEILMGMGGIPSYTIMRGSGAIERVEEGFYLPWSISRNVIKSNINLILRRQLFQEYKSQHPRGWKVEEAKAALVRRLQRFDSLAVHRPLFFSTIYTDYGGDIVKYVDALYETAIMAKKKNLRAFMCKPTTFAIQNDLGYQFSLSLALYEQWIAQVRNGEINEE